MITPTQKHFLKPLISIIFAILTIFLILNILYSQNISPLYFTLVSEDKKAVVNFLKKIKLLPDKNYFKDQLAEYKGIYGDSIRDDVFKDDKNRQESIKEMQKLLEKSPNSRDLLYNLYLLEKEEGNKTQSQIYLQKAKEIDVNINE